MKRAEFIRNTALGTLGLSLFPWRLLADIPSNKFKMIILPDLVPQPRHGNFTASSFEVDDLLKVHSRDRLLKNGLDLSDQDMLSINLELDGLRMNITVSDKECWVNAETDSKKMKIYPGENKIARNFELVMGYATIKRNSKGKRHYILPLAGQYKIDHLLYHENTCMRSEGVEEMTIETSKSSRILLISA
jgi:hypothetical protein